VDHGSGPVAHLERPPGTSLLASLSARRKETPSVRFVDWLQSTRHISVDRTRSSIADQANPRVQAANVECARIVVVTTGSVRTRNRDITPRNGSVSAGKAARPNHGQVIIKFLNNSRTSSIGIRWCGDASRWMFLPEYRARWRAIDARRAMLEPDFDGGNEASGTSQTMSSDERSAEPSARATEPQSRWPEEAGDGTFCFCSALRQIRSRPAGPAYNPHWHYEMS